MNLNVGLKLGLKLGLPRRKELPQWADERILPSKWIRLPADWIPEERLPGRWILPQEE